MAGFGNFTNLTWTNGGAPAINDVNLQAAWDAIETVDNELRRSQTLNAKDLLEYFYNVNCKEIDNFTDYSEYTAWASTTLSNDSTNNCMGKNAVKTLESDNTASYVGMWKNITSMDLTNFPNASSDTSDIIMCIFYISDVSKVSTITYKVGTDNANNYNVTYAAATCITGWNVKRPHKSDFSTTGAPAGWDDITYVVFQWYSTVNAQNAYITFQYCSLYREDASFPDYYNPFQKYFGATTGWVNLFSIDSDYFALYFDEAVNRIGLMRINPSRYTDTLYLYSQEYTNFISKWEFFCKKAGYLPSIVWYVDANNYAEVYISANVLYLDVLQGGVLSSQSSALTANLLLNERVELYFEKELDSIKIIANTGKESLIIMTKETTIADTSVGYIYVWSVAVSNYGLLTDFVISATPGHRLPERKFIFIKKPASEIVNNSTVLQNDNDFLLYLPPNGIYEIELKLHLTGAANADFKCDWVVGGGCSQLTTRACIGPPIATADVTDTNLRSTGYNLTTAVNYGTDGTSASAILEKFLVGTTTAGTLQFRWAQNTAQASDTTLNISCYVKATKLN
jgi:hypothetical protein